MRKKKRKYLWICLQSIEFSHTTPHTERRGRNISCQTPPNIKVQKLGSSFFSSEDSVIYIIEKRFLANTLKTLTLLLLLFSTLLLNTVIYMWPAQQRDWDYLQGREAVKGNGCHQTDLPLRNTGHKGNKIIFF